RIKEAIIGLHNSGQRPALTQRRHITGYLHGSYHRIFHVPNLVKFTLYANLILAPPILTLSSFPKANRQIFLSLSLPWIHQHSTTALSSIANNYLQRRLPTTAPLGGLCGRPRLPTNF